MLCVILRIAAVEVYGGLIVLERKPLLVAEFMEEGKYPLLLCRAEKQRAMFVFVIGAVAPKVFFHPSAQFRMVFFLHIPEEIAEPPCSVHRMDFPEEGACAALAGGGIDGHAEQLVGGKRGSRQVTEAVFFQFTCLVEAVLPAFRLVSETGFDVWGFVFHVACF